MHYIKHLVPFIPKSIGAIRKINEFADFIANAKPNSLILAPELTFSGYENCKLPDNLYDILVNSCSDNKACGFSKYSLKNSKIYNEFNVIDSNGMVYSRAKSKHFLPNKEQELFSIIDSNMVQTFEYCGVKLGVLICFELRFIELWTRLSEADIILVPAMWGKSRKKHLNSLCAGLATINHAYVIVASGGTNCYNKASVYTPDSKILSEALFNIDLIKNIKNSIYKGQNG